MPAAILRDGHAQLAARDLLKMKSVGWPDQLHGIAALGLSTSSGPQTGWLDSATPHPQRTPIRGRICEYEQRILALPIVCCSDDDT